MALHWHSPSEPPSNLPAVAESGAQDILDFDPVALAPRLDGWTPERQRAFIEELADCGVVSEAAARVGMTDRSARRLRRRPDAQAFNLAWEAALRLGEDRLRSAAYERAVLGTVKPRFYRGEKIGEERVYSDRLLVYLLGRHKLPPYADRTTDIIRDWEGWMGAIEEGVPNPIAPPADGGESPVWEAEDGSWWTSFPPPPGYEGEQVPADDEYGYRRELSPSELEAVRGWKKREASEEARNRDAYFARMKRNFRTPR